MLCRGLQAGTVRREFEWSGREATRQVRRKHEDTLKLQHEWHSAAERVSEGSEARESEPANRRVDAHETDETDGLPATIYFDICRPYQRATIK